jgi:pimeloyl-ACP methyl ester carboxylesterase
VVHIGAERVETIEASDGVGLYVEEHGKAPGEGIPIIFSCGYCTTHENWRPQVAPLVEAGARVILHDFRGHGLSEAPDKQSAYSMEQVIDDLSRVVDWAAPEEPAVLAGHSFGGLASLHLAARQPQRVRGLVLLATGPGFKNPEAAQKWADQCERSASYLEQRGLDAFLAGRAGETCIGRRPELPGARAAAAAIAKQSVSGLAFFGREVAGKAPPIMDELPGLECPALVLIGAEDKPYLRAGEVMEAKLGGRTQREMLPGIGHVANLEDPEAFNARVIAFLDSL